MTVQFHEDPVVMGCDPEFFFLKDNKIQGAETVLPPEGLVINRNGRSSSIIIDGVQAELNPAPETCREFLSHNISRCLQTLAERIRAQGGKIDVSFNQTFKVHKKTLDKLSDKAKVLGCSPSSNAYHEKARITIKKAQNVRIRSGGGHIHLGSGNPFMKEILQTSDRLVPLLDAVVGNTCVLIDRDPGNVIRRRYYGRAGEYRSPKHGIEYRVLSNFWMRNYALMSFVFGLARQTVLIASNSGFARDYAKELMSKVKKIDVKRAINNNDAELARKNFDAIAPLLSKWFHDAGRYPLSHGSIELFNHFAEKGMDYWFKEDPLTHWIERPLTLAPGWHVFLSTVVAPDLRKQSNANI